MIAVMKTDDAGVVTETSMNAAALLGRCMGRSCHEVVQAIDREKAPICNRICFRANHSITDITGVTVNKRNGRFLCVPMNGGRLVVWMPWVRKESAGLTSREAQVLTKVAQGLTSAEIAKVLCIQPSTVRTHVENAREKLMARTRAELVAKAIMSGRINPEV